MAKRFTDTDKWKRPWFRQLNFKAKLAWFFILDNCDHCGVWHADFELMVFQTGVKITKSEFEEWFSGKFTLIDGDKYFFPSFVTFQQGDLSTAKNAHKPIILFLEKNGLSLEEKNDPIGDQSGSHQDPILMGPSISISKGNSKGKEGGLGETSPFEKIWSTYPNKINKAEGFRRLSEQKLSDSEIEDGERASANYARYCALPWNDWYTPMHFDVWCGAKSKSVKPWHEWKDPDPSVFVEKSKTPTPIKGIQETLAEQGIIIDENGNQVSA